MCILTDIILNLGVNHLIIPIYCYFCDIINQIKYEYLSSSIKNINKKKDNKNLKQKGEKNVINTKNKNKKNEEIEFEFQD